MRRRQRRWRWCGKRYAIKNSLKSTTWCNAPAVYTMTYHQMTMMAMMIITYAHFGDDQLSGFYRATAMLSAVYAVVVCLCLSVWVCVCVPDTLRYCIKTAKCRITQTTPHDSAMTLVFWCQRSWRNSNGIIPYGCDKCRWGGLKLVTFDKKRAITRKRYKIAVYFLLKSNSYVFDDLG